MVLLLVPEMVLAIGSVKLQTDSERAPSMVMGERVLLAVVERVERVVRVGRGAEEELEEVVVVVRVTERVSVEVLPFVEESRAVIIMVLVPTTRGTLLADQEVVPLTVPQEEPFTVQVTEARPEESEAVPERLMVD